VLVIAPNAIQKAIGESRNVSKSQNSTEGQVVYEDYVRATALLKSGDVEGARQIIDRQQEASIAISIHEGMSGALANSSGSMLILRLAKAISRYASEKAWNGDTEGALAWVERCRMLSRQSLSSTTITLESVQLAGSIDSGDGSADALRLRQSLRSRASDASCSGIRPILEKRYSSKDARRTATMRQLSSCYVDGKDTRNRDNEGSRAKVSRGLVQTIPSGASANADRITSSTN